MDADKETGSDGRLLPAAAITALTQGNTIAAIKVVREQRQLGLKQAKDWVESYVRTQPALQQAAANSQAKAKRSALLFLVIAIILALLIRWYAARA